MPFVMAGVVSKKHETAKILEQLGEIIGLIFQLKDDMIGLLGNEETIGKPVGSDIRENKKTLIRALLYEYANVSEKKLLNSAFGNKNLSTDQVVIVKKLIEKYKILKTLNREIDEIMDKAWKLFAKLEVSDEYRKIFKDLMEFNLKRTY